MITQKVVYYIKRALRHDTSDYSETDRDNLVYEAGFCISLVCNWFQCIEHRSNNWKYVWIDLTTLYNHLTFLLDESDWSKINYLRVDQKEKIIKQEQAKSWITTCLLNLQPIVTSPVVRACFSRKMRSNYPCPYKSDNTVSIIIVVDLNQTTLLALSIGTDFDGMNIKIALFVPYALFRIKFSKHIPSNKLLRKPVFS